MVQKTKPSDVFDEYQRGRSFKDGLGLFETVEVNENFYVGNHWEGLNAPDLPKPVINIVHRIVSWCVAQVVSDDVAISIAALKKDDQIALIAEALKSSVDRAFELMGAKQKNRQVARNGAVHGDCAKYFWFDPEIENGQSVKGEICSEICEGRNVYFGNPFMKDVQSQPDIIIRQRKLLSEVRDEAKANGMNETEITKISLDTDENTTEQSDDYEQCTVLIKMWKKNGTIWAEKVTQNAYVRKPFDTGMTLYPIAWFVWEEVSEQYHGRPIVTGLVQNQVAINRIFAMFIRSVEMNAFPKVVYDGDVIKTWSNKVGEAIKATPGPNGFGARKLIENVRGGDIGSQAMEAIQAAIGFMKDSVGATDVALGNVRPDNAQAIVVASQQARVPMEMPKLNHNDCIEQEVRIIVDMMRNYYGKRQVSAEEYKTADGQTLVDQEGKPVKTIAFDFAKLDNPNMRINVEVGTAAYWSEITQQASLDNLFASGVLDAKLYVESIPDNNLRNKGKIVEYLEKQAAIQQQMQQQQMQQLPAGRPMNQQENTQQTPGGVFQ